MCGKEPYILVPRARKFGFQDDNGGGSYGCVCGGWPWGVVIAVVYSMDITSQ